jgi:hypothetical protein
MSSPTLEELEAAADAAIAAYSATWEALKQAVTEALARPDVRAWVRVPACSGGWSLRVFDTDPQCELWDGYGWNWVRSVPDDMPADAEAVGRRLYELDQAHREANAAYGRALQAIKAHVEARLARFGLLFK